MNEIGSWVAEAAAVSATALTVVGVAPQIHRVVVGRDWRGVSVTSAALGVGTESAWLVYAAAGGLWTALPEAALMAATNLTMVVALSRRGVAARSALRIGGVWLALFAMVGLVGGRGAVGALLGVSYAIQVAPAVWTTWRTATPSGVARSTWLLVGVEGMLWGLYGVHYGDPATSSFAVIAVVSAATILAGTTRGARRLQLRRRSAAFL